MSRRTSWLRQPPKSKQNHSILRLRGFQINFREKGKLQISGCSGTQHLSQHPVARTNLHDRNTRITTEKTTASSKKSIQNSGHPAQLSGMCRTGRRRMQYPPLQNRFRHRLRGGNTVQRMARMDLVTLENESGRQRRQPTDARLRPRQVRRVERASLPTIAVQRQQHLRL